MNNAFHEGGVALTNAAASTFAHTHCGRKGKKLKRRWEREKPDIISQNTKEEARLKVRII